MDAVLVVAVFAIVAFAAFGHTVAGFGFSMLAVPPLGLVIDPKAAVAAAALLLVANSALLAWGEKAHVDWRAVRLLVVGALPGLPLGLVLLVVMPVPALRIVLAVAIVTAVVILWSGFEIEAGGSVVELAAGFATGVLTTSINANGPPTVLALQGRRLEPQAFRPTTSAVLGLTSAVGAVLFVVAGRMTGEALGVVAVAIPAMLSGWLIGLRFRSLLAPEVFRALVLCLLLVAAAATAVAAFS